jgi:hypothetical protein
MTITPKNWRDFQHYKDRNPPWIRLHKKLLDDFDFYSLPIASKALAPMLWLLASESVSGVISLSIQKIAFRVRMSEHDLSAALKPLIDGGFFEMEQDASSVLAESLRDAVPMHCITETSHSIAETKTRAPRFDAQAHLSSLGVSDSGIADWMTHRKTVKASVTLTAITGIAREAAKGRLSLDAALAMCCERGWRGFKAEWLSEARAGPTSRQESLASAARMFMNPQGIDHDRTIDITPATAFELGE